MMTPPFIILVTGHEIRANSSQEVTQKVSLFEIVRIEAQHQEIQSPFYFLVSLILFDMIFGMVNFHTRHVSNSLWNFLMERHWYSRCNIYDRRRNPRCWIQYCHHKFIKLCQWCSGIFELPICFVGWSVCW